MLKKVFMVVGVVIALNSCVSGSLVFESEPVESRYSEIFSNKIIGVEPFDVEFSSSRFAIDLRDVSLSVNGQKVVFQKKYITKVDVDGLGEVGILEINALKKTDADANLIQSQVTKEWILGLLGDSNYTVGFFNKFGEGNSGFLSNRPLERDENYEFVFLPTDKPTTYFKEVRDLTNISADGVDYILRGYIDISNEVVELLTPEEDEYSNRVFEDTSTVGGYYLLCNAYIEWEIVDVVTNEVVVNYKEKSDDRINTRNSIKILLPIPNGDSNAFESYFNNKDLTPFASKEVLELMPRAYQFMAPYYKVTSRFIKDQE
ncbi:hypothetical protein EW093_07910 [Thiospirochaeta perfilievii]|uniref:Uncharacterized protein n=1 Tax=Thiospirochaeta perfilievii TaxID=252967 RepID=A0A5C1QC07_9SPIO|nr:hypothetical protein [Thiospirochaeta perfilievii]QEN04630.1 hypothetical protein EW093_07910 [Thiospirochaeta perfilievii]